MDNVQMWENGLGFTVNADSLKSAKEIAATISAFVEYDHEDYESRTGYAFTIVPAIEALADVYADDEALAQYLKIIGGEDGETPELACVYDDARVRRGERIDRGELRP